ncbi:MAG: DUF1634 domain-containing protein [Puia sp.]|nr:DUF1634 domain-containing protein [Puia sp.]
MKKFRHDRDIQVTIGNLLRSGVVLAFVIVLAGAIVYLVRHGGQIPEYQVFRGGSGSYHTFSAIWEGLITGHGRAIIQFGIVILILTPIARIAFSVIGFLLEKDYLYAGITLAVLAIILISLMAGMGV